MIDLFPLERWRQWLFPLIDSLLPLFPVPLQALSQLLSSPVSSVSPSEGCFVSYRLLCHTLCPLDLSSLLPRIQNRSRQSFSARNVLRKGFVSWKWTTFTGMLYVVIWCAVTKSVCLTVLRFRNTLWADNVVWKIPLLFFIVLNKAMWTLYVSMV